MTMLMHTWLVHLTLLLGALVVVLYETAGGGAGNSKHQNRHRLLRVGTVLDTREMPSVLHQSSWRTRFFQRRLWSNGKELGLKQWYVIFAAGSGHADIEKIANETGVVFSSFIPNLAGTDAGARLLVANEIDAVQVATHTGDRLQHCMNMPLLQAVSATSSTHTIMVVILTHDA